MAGSFNGIRVFSATIGQERLRLGERVEQWIAANPGREVLDIVVEQSSDHEYHCLTFVVFYRE